MKLTRIFSIVLAIVFFSVITSETFALNLNPFKKNKDEATEVKEKKSHSWNPLKAFKKDDTDKKKDKEKSKKKKSWNPLSSLKKKKKEKKAAPTAAAANPLKYSFQDKTYSMTRKNTAKAQRFLSLGNKYNKEIKYDKAIHYYKKALKNDWTYPNIHFNLGTALFYNNEFADAKVGFRNYLQFKPEDTDALYYLGIISYKLEEINNAVAYFKKILEIDPNNEKAKKNYQRLKEVQLSRPAESRVAAMPQPEPEPVTEVSSITPVPEDKSIETSALTKPNTAGAGKSALDKKISLLYMKRGFEAFQKRDYKNAEYHYLQALKYDDSNFTTYFNVGVANYYLENYKKAKEIFTNLTDVKKDADTLVYLGLTYYKLGNKEQAASCFNKALAINPLHRKAFKFLEHIRASY